MRNESRVEGDLAFITSIKPYKHTSKLVPQINCHILVKLGSEFETEKTIGTKLKLVNRNPNPPNQITKHITTQRREEET